MNVSSWLKRTTTSNNLTRLDAELILAHAIKKERIFLHAHPEFELSEAARTLADSLVARRQKHEAIAYLVGHKEFYGRSFRVNPDVLIPRPESEEIIELAKNLSPAPRKLLDVGTGSGCLAITLQLELPSSELLALDISSKALALAKQNAESLGATLEFRQSDLLSALRNDEKFDLIVANLPYVDKNWDWLSSELAFEPDLALYAPDGGLALIKKLAVAAPKHLNSCGALILESDSSQHATIQQFIEQNTPLRLQKTSGLIQLFAEDAQ